MPTSLPVPSKGALRTLRHLALGTSCTVAISAGLLTEDRRRRIHAAREVHDNAQKLKSSRKYHSAGTVAIETFEEQVSRLQDDAFWLPSNVARSKILKPSNNSKDSERATTQTQTGPHLLSYRDIITGPHRPTAFQSLAVRKPARTSGQSKQTLYNRQLRLSHDVRKLMNEEPSAVGAAVARFLEAFEEGLGEEGSQLLEPLIDTAIMLSQACKKGQDLENSDRIFDAIFGYGALNEEDYHRFNPHEMITRLMEQSHPDNPVDIAKLKKGSAIYLARFKENPQAMSDEMVQLGEELCTKACNAELYDLCAELHFRISKCGEPDSPRTTQFLLKATHGKGQHKRMFRLFKNFFARTTPSSSEFYEVTSLVIDSLVKIKEFNKAEEVLMLAVPLAERTASSLSTTWFLKVLGQHWRDFRDIQETRALFDRLKPPNKHPQALYIAMIQCYIEAGDEVAATTLFNHMKFLYELRPKDVRVYGHFALAKAMRRDWIGVRADLIMMKTFNPEDCDTFNSCFAPILKLYFNAHSVSESEDFIRFYVEECELRLNGYIMNLMINAYAKAQEIDSLTRWISFAASQGVTMDSVTFNTLLHNLYHSWRLSYGDILTFYRKIRSMEGASLILMDDDTSSMLRRLAILDGTKEDIIVKRLQRLKPTSQPLDTLDPSGVHLKMAMAYGKGNITATLKIYKNAQSLKIQLGPEHLHLAVRASLRMVYDEPDETTSLIRDAQTRGLDVSQSITAVFIHQLTKMREAGERDPDVIIHMTMTTVELFQNSNIRIPPSVLTHTASILQRGGHNRQAIDFWKTMSRNLKLAPSAMDIAAYTVLCKAYSASLNVYGVGSIIEAIKVNNITPDNRFKAMLKAVQKDVIQILVDKPQYEKARKFLACILHARQQVKEMRAHAGSAKAEVQWKALQIIETAMEEQILHGKRSSSINERSRSTGSERNIRAAAAPSMLSGQGLGNEAWVMDDDPTAVPNRLAAGSAAG